MAATLPFRTGQNLQATGDPRALFLKMFAGEVLLAYERRSITNGKVFEKTIGAGKSHSFPLMGAIGSGYHTPGNNIIEDAGLQEPQVSEKIISLDGFLITSTLVSDIDDLMNHWDTRRPISREMGWELARQYDINNLAVIAKGANDPATIGSDLSDWGKGGTVQLDTDFRSGAASDALDTIEAMAVSMDVNDVPEYGRHLAIDPDIYHKLAGYSEIVSSDYNANTGGDIGLGRIMMIHGINIWSTNRLVDLRTRGDYTVNVANQYGGDYIVDTSFAVGIGWQEDRSIGALKLGNIGAKTEYKLNYLADFMVAGFSTGHGVLHESACYLIETQTPV